MNPKSIVSNRDLLMSKFLIEKQYREHRERIMSTSKVIDDSMVIPLQILKMKSYKKLTKTNEEKRINEANEKIFRRMSNLHTELPQNLTVPLGGAEYFGTRLRNLIRLRQHRKININNDKLYNRLRKAKFHPEHSRANAKEWYDQQMRFRAAR